MSIKYISQKKQVDMNDDWYSQTSLNHFWIRRRFEVFRTMCSKLDLSDMNTADIGCGRGLFQKQVEQFYNTLIEGIDLNENALINSIVKSHNLYYYDIAEMNSHFKTKYDHLIIFDVLEHIKNDIEFLECTKFHLRKGGYITINVPAIHKLYSNYDKEMGHHRRYDINDFQKIADNLKLKIHNQTYWGLGIVPLLIIRKLVSDYIYADSKNNIVNAGINPKYAIINRLFGILSRLEFIPQKLIGTSLMVILSNDA